MNKPKKATPDYPGDAKFKNYPAPQTAPMTVRELQCKGCDLYHEDCSCRDEIERLMADNKELYEKNLDKDVTIIRQLNEKKELEAKLKKVSK